MGAGRMGTTKEEEVQGKRGFSVARAVKAAVAGTAVAATAIALGSFVLYRVGLDAYAGALLGDRFPLALAVSAALLAVVLYRRFDR